MILLLSKLTIANVTDCSIVAFTSETLIAQVSLLLKAPSMSKKAARAYSFTLSDLEVEPYVGVDEVFKRLEDE